VTRTAKNQIAENSGCGALPLKGFEFKERAGFGKGMF
jgi:hypothetical protein